MIIDFSIPKCTFEVLKIASKLNKKVVIGMTYGSPSPIITFAVHQIPRRIKKMVFKHLCGCDVQYLRMYEVLPNMPQKVFEKHMKSVRKLVRGL